jgi:hypothetical protein
MKTDPIQLFCTQFAGPRNYEMDERGQQTRAVTWPDTPGLSESDLHSLRHSRNFFAALQAVAEGKSPGLRNHILLKWAGTPVSLHVDHGAISRALTTTRPPLMNNSPDLPQAIADSARIWFEKTVQGLRDTP